MRYDLALTGVQTEAHFASLRHYPLNICSDHTLRVSHSEIVQITQRKVGALRSYERMNGGTEKERSQRVTLLWALLGQNDMRSKIMYKNDGCEYDERQKCIQLG